MSVLTSRRNRSVNPLSRCSGPERPRPDRCSVASARSVRALTALAWILFKVSDACCQCPSEGVLVVAVTVFQRAECLERYGHGGRPRLFRQSLDANKRSLIVTYGNLERAAEGSSRMRGGRRAIRDLALKHIHVNIFEGWSPFESALTVEALRRRSNARRKLSWLSRSGLRLAPVVPVPVEGGWTSQTWFSRSSGSAATSSSKSRLDCSRTAVPRCVFSIRARRSPSRSPRGPDGTCTEVFGCLPRPLRNAMATVARPSGGGGVAVPEHAAEPGSSWTPAGRGQYRFPVRSRPTAPPVRAWCGTASPPRAVVGPAPSCPPQAVESLDQGTSPSGSIRPAASTVSASCTVRR